MILPYDDFFFKYTVNTQQKRVFFVVINDKIDNYNQVECGVMQSETKYVIRQAAGSLWLVKCAQSGKYIQPIPVNECGALICEGIMSNMTLKDIAYMLAKEYNVAKESAVCDVNEFINELKLCGMDLL